MYPLVSSSLKIFDFVLHYQHVVHLQLAYLFAQKVGCEAQRVISQSVVFCVSTSQGTNAFPSAALQRLYLKEVKTQMCKPIFGLSQFLVFEVRYLSIFFFRKLLDSTTSSLTNRTSVKM